MKGTLVGDLIHGEVTKADTRSVFNALLTKCQGRNQYKLLNCMLQPANSGTVCLTYLVDLKIIIIIMVVTTKMFFYILIVQTQ